MKTATCWHDKRYREFRIRCIMARMRPGRIIRSNRCKSGIDSVLSSVFHNVFFARKAF